MKTAIFLLCISLLFLSCSKKPAVIFKEFPHTRLKPVAIETLPEFNAENFDAVLQSFQKNCQTKKAFEIYENLCNEAKYVSDVETFIRENFQAYQIVNDKEDDTGLLTGYYEAEIHASYQKSDRYKYPVYATPKDLVVVDLSQIYPELKHYRLRGRLDGNRVIPYLTRGEAKTNELNASVLCYCDSEIDKFFLEVQGSGIAKLDDNSSFYLGYDNQNGYKYRSIGKYLVKKNELSLEEVSLQSIREWLREHPDRIDEVLNYNNSMVFFSKREHGATGALGVELTPMRSIAVDKRYISLGSMLYLHADLNNTKINKIVFAQDTGGAIKGTVRADLFVGSGEEALALAGHLKAPLKLWLLLPKEKEKNE
ncbi:murein transglycosylase A [Sulfurimonas paralvinellae]|uniref:peptidoglycan lytic exotransglycosylase n=1 Tax=Sulfurimonas paralvinellae TaxID=317658 RepID=A0A7M1B8H6_9BACT|nr:murein transglycosylase A [Sulfurimonas paralvinellae]QOP45985.1 transglycosylase [Sulfurimonas paralvinellae]